MARRLFNVTNLFTIRGWGIVLLPGIVPINHERFGPGDPLLLKRPDGTELQTRIKWLEWRGTYLEESPGPRPYTVLLEGLIEEDVPQGTEVWSVDAERRAENQTLERTGAARKRSWLQKVFGRAPGR
jgi:hypothetical protein